MSGLCVMCVIGGRGRVEGIFTEVIRMMGCRNGRWKWRGKEW